MDTITCTINGKKENLNSKTTLLRYLKSKEINPHGVACELNLKVIRRNTLNQVELKEGDTLEIIRMIGGG